MTSVFPLVLKTVQVVLVFKKDSKFDYSNNRPISLLSLFHMKIPASVTKACIKIVTRPQTTVQLIYIYTRIF